MRAFCNTGRMPLVKLAALFPSSLTTGSGKTTADAQLLSRVASATTGIRYCVLASAPLISSVLRVRALSLRVWYFR